MCEDKLAEGVVEGVAVDAIAHCEDEIGRGAVHGVSGGDHFAAGTQDIIDGAF